MITCTQCNSEISESDAFCPYCGISLIPVEVVSEDDEFASTIMMSPDIVVDPEPAADITEPPPESNEAEPVFEDQVLDESTGTDDEIVEEPEPNEPTANGAPSVEVTAPQSFEPFQDPTIDGDDSAAAGADDLAPSEPEMPEQPRSASDEFTEAPTADSVDVSMSEIEVLSGDIQPEIQEELSSSNEIADSTIAKPEEILEMPDAGGPSTFDSVRIIDDRMTPTGTRPPSPETPTPPSSSASLSRSQTSSGIGLVDTDGRRSAKLKPLEEGIVLNGRYEIVRKIGGGGMGAVYLASDNNLGGVLRAVKEMVQAHIEEEQQVKAIEDFKRESMILSQLDHPSIPTIYDYFFDESEGRFYLVMKYISGGDLSARLRAAPEGKIDEKSVVEWGIQIADVLDYLHSQPSTIVYRDLKPSNIMIDGNTGRVMLIDFGIARSINQKEEKGVTAVGTMGYAPPELFSGNVEPRSDIYSLGSTMFHLLTGADPQSNPLLIFDFQKNPRPRQINSQLSDQIELFIMKAVEYNASARFENAAEVRGALTEHLANLNKGMVTYGVKAVPESVSLANQPVFCGFCGQRIVATDLFCAFCGAKQPIAQKGVHSEIYGRGASTARLLVEGTSELQSPIFSIDKNEVLIGRRDPMSNIFPEVDLSKYDPQTKISRRHARIWREGNTFLVEDLGSSNGTMLVPIVHESFRLAPRQPHALTNGDKIRVGDTTLHFVVN
jgi:eukaryotic-like serine/threonine-protein kinase